MEKKCNVCELIKPLDEFHNKKNGRLGKTELCKLCKKAVDRKRWETLSEGKKKEIRERENKYYHEVIKMKSEKGRKINRSKESVNRAKRKQRENPLIRLKDNMRKCVGRYLKKVGVNKDNHTFEFIGCSPEFLREYITKGFTDGMDWENYGKWHIDHVIPLCSAKNENELIKLFHYTNLQPLWATDNISKGGKIKVKSE